MSRFTPYRMIFQSEVDHLNLEHFLRRFYSEKHVLRRHEATTVDLNGSHLVWELASPTSYFQTIPCQNDEEITSDTSKYLLTSEWIQRSVIQKSFNSRNQLEWLIIELWSSWSRMHITMVHFENSSSSKMRYRHVQIDRYSLILEWVSKESDSVAMIPSRIWETLFRSYHDHLYVGHSRPVQLHNHFSV